jgi:hypothetical protein
LKALSLALTAALCALLVACSAGRASVPEWVPPSSEATADYALFSVRCSKCHSLARPLSSGIDDDAYWATYVAKMRRQPGSGISASDAAAALRVLHFYALDQRRKKGRFVEPPPTAPEPDAAPPPGAP